MEKAIFIIGLCWIVNACPNNDVYCKYVPVINNSYQGNLDDIRFIELQIDAVTTDMYRYLGWFFDEKDMMKRASIKAISDLRTIKDYLQQISFTDDLLELRDINITIIDNLIQTYDNIDIKQEEEIRKDFDEYSEIFCQYIKKFEEYSSKHNFVGKLPEDFNIREQEIVLIHNTKDRKAYLNAIELIEAKKYAQAYNILLKLKDK